MPLKPAKQQPTSRKLTRCSRSLTSTPSPCRLGHHGIRPTPPPAATCNGSPQISLNDGGSTWTSPGRVEVVGEWERRGDWGRSGNDGVLSPGMASAAIAMKISHDAAAALVCRPLDGRDPAGEGKQSGQRRDGAAAGREFMRRCRSPPSP
jgi:hypothetical protein